MSELAPALQTYATAYSRSARDLRATLSELQRATLMDVEDRLSDDPDAEEHDRIPLGPDLFVYRHPRPRIEVTCQIDRERRVVNILHVVAPRLEVPRSLFISYSHRDESWLTELRRVLRPLEQADLIAIWDDREIRAGGRWREEIERALRNARAALLLVSPSFLESEFIGTIELPRILGEARSAGLQVFWVAVAECSVKDSPLFEFQSVNDPERPLAKLDGPDQARELARIYERIRAVVAQP